MPGESRSIKANFRFAEVTMSVYTCSMCGYQYDESVEKVPFDQLPDDWQCPICNAPKSAFEKTQ